jgi:hypothetical protein
MYKDSSHPFRSVVLVSRFLEDDWNFQIVVEKAGRLVASAAMTYQPWNDSYELGRALTVPEFRRNGLACLLMRQVVDWVSEAGLGELFFGYPRVRLIARLGAALIPPLVVVGHDDGRNVANGSREIHLISCGVLRHARFIHIRPEVAGWAYWRFLLEIDRSLGLAGVPGEYPPECFVGNSLERPLTIGGWRFDHNPGGALEILGRETNSRSPEQIADELDAVLALINDARHITATVLADKMRIIHALTRHRFRVSAYLPAWYKLRRFRYDCIQLTRRQYPGEPATQDLADYLAALDTEFRRAPYYASAAAA